ncbi:hypothetical protein FNV43_RR17881 [Rhamnella rubrinervis]|uniref:Uncharacterized protein n=1 Tax=Rhamnella rubrinervis TaxID=2594499 RepID=A0A8K0GW16_9ROSA|nr:hypothetical protein FNV43_RR17881 [Rhamnella rubrinervis]
MPTLTSVGKNQESYSEGIASRDDKDSFGADGLLEQLNVTRGADKGFLKNGQLPVVNVSSAGHALQVVINGQLSEARYPPTAGINKTVSLSIAVGLQNIGLHFEALNVGVIDHATLEGLNGGIWDMSKWKWSYKSTFAAPEGNDLRALDMSSMGKGQIWDATGLHIRPLEPV